SGIPPSASIATHCNSAASASTKPLPPPRSSHLSKCPGLGPRTPYIRPGAAESSGNSLCRLRCKRRLVRRGGPQPIHRLEEQCVLVRRPHRDANCIRKAHPAQRPNNHACEQQLVAELLRSRADLHKDEIRLARHRAQSHCAKPLVQALPLRRVGRLTSL